MMKKLTVGEYLLKAIKNLGIGEVFGIPGDMVIRFFKVIENDPDLKIYTFSHEPGVGFAAIGASRASRKPAVVCITFGAGGLNTLNAVACAYAEKTPLIVISGGPGENEKLKHSFLHHTVKDYDSQLKAYREVTKEAVILDNPRTSFEKIERTLKLCEEFMLPVYIEIPRDIVDKNIHIPDKIEDFSSLPDLKVTRQVVNKILRRIKQAEKPVILAGVETDRFNLKKSVIDLGKRMNIPIVTMFLSRDIIPDQEPNYFGTYLGLAGNPIARKLVEESDCLLMLGVIISDMNLGIRLKRINKEAIILCVSQQVKISDDVYSNIPLKTLIEELLNRNLEKKKIEFPEKPELIINRTCKYDNRLINTSEIIDAINWFFSSYGEMPIISDTGDCLFTTIKIKSPMVMASAYYSTMGFGVPASIGYAVKTGKRPLVLVGDGGFQMTGQEICHCKRFGINPIFIVFNNRSWGMQKLFDPTAGFNELVNWPYAKIGELLGGKGYFVDNCEKLYRALEKARDDKLFSLIEVFLDKDEYSQELLAWLNELKGEL